MIRFAERSLLRGLEKFVPPRRPNTEEEVKHELEVMNANP
jgi:hypothetical protein